MGECGRGRVVRATAKVNELYDAILAATYEQIFFDWMEIYFVDGSFVELERIVESELRLANYQPVQLSVGSTRNSNGF